MANTLKFGNGQWATGNGTALAYNDENANFKPLPFDFTRASSGTVVNQSGLIETVGSGIPRIDFQGNTKGALLLEPQRLNYVGQSETFTGYWGLQGASLIADNNVKNPTGNTFSNILNTTSTGTFKSINKSESSAWDSKTLTVSCFAKKITNDYIYFYNIGSVSGVNGTWFNINDGTLGISGGAWSNEKIENYGNGWYRCSAKITFGADTNYIYINNSDGNNNNSSTIGSQTYIWGTQVEEGSYPTSYIPTSGSTVTRVADACSQTPPDGVIGQTEGTIFLDFVLNSVDGNLDFRFLLSRGNSTNYWIFVGMTNGDIRGYVNNTTNQFDSTFTGVVGTRYKLALAYKQNDFAFYANGIQKSVSTSGTIPSVDRVMLGNTVTSLNMVVKESVNQAQIYNTRLSNSELAALTQV
jgi:hypothetical protein